MKISNKTILISCTIIAIIFLGLSIIWMSFNISLPKANSIEDHEIIIKYLSFELDVYRTIIISFLIAVLGLIIPNMLPEMKYEFERKKEGRRIYSEAKTGIDYLHFELADLDMKEAREHIHRIHVLKHLADLYIKEDENIAIWPYKKPYEAYEIIMEYLYAIEDYKNPWNEMTYDQRRKKLTDIYDKIKRAM